jgi:hypothetical protein
MMRWSAINFKVVHNTGSQIDTGLLQAFGENDVVFGKVVEANELWHDVSISHHLHLIHHPMPHLIIITFL